MARSIRFSFAVLACVAVTCGGFLGCGGSSDDTSGAAAGPATGAGGVGGSSSVGGSAGAAASGAGGTTQGGGTGGAPTTGGTGGGGGQATAGSGGAQATGGGGGTGGGGSDVQAACAAQSMAVCAKQDQCRNQLSTREYGSISECVARQTQQCLSNHAAPGTGATVAATQACAASWMSATCAVVTGVAPVCPPVAGQIANDGACAVNGQCASSFCSIADNAACGKCAPVPAMGAACDNGHCGPSALSCDNTSMTCVALGTSGSTCSKAAPCGPGLGCVGKMGAATCQPLVPTMGAACDPKGATLPHCDSNAGLFCDKSMTCQPDKTATAGQPCGLDQMASTLTVCGGKSACIEPMGTTAGTCQAAAADGAPCDTAAGPPCEQPARCVVTGTGTAGTCTLLDGAKCM